MATVLIIATDHLIGGLLGQLTDLAGHAAQFRRENEEPSEAVRQCHPGVVMLDAAYGPATTDRVADAAADVGAPVVFFAWGRPTSELRRMALNRGAKYFALPAGPKLLGRVLASALATDRVAAELSASAMRYAVVSAVSAVQRARAIAEQVGNIKATNDALRAEHESLLAECRRRAAELREAVIAYTRELRAAGVPPDRTLDMIRDAMRREWTGTGAAPDIAPQIDDATEWCLQAYYAA